MKEIELSTDEDADPLHTCFNLNADMAKTYEKQSHSPFIDSQDVKVISDITKANFGHYPVSLDWSRPQNWKNILLSRIEPAFYTNYGIHNHFLKKYGKESDLAISTGIVADITPEVTKIAGVQMEGYKGPRAWQTVDEESSRSLSLKIEAILSTPSYGDFFLINPTFKDGLLLIKNTFVKTSNPNILRDVHSMYLEQCIKDNSQGKIVLNIPFESDYTHPVKKEADKTMICEASLSILLPLAADGRKALDKITLDSREFLAKRKYARKSQKLNLLVGESLCGAGVDVLSAVSGEAFNIAVEGKTEYGFYLAINNLAKKEVFWKKSGELMGFNEEELNADLTDYFTTLYIPHENAHIIFPQYDIYGEVPADVPAVIFSIAESAKNANINGGQMIRAIFSEYASDALEMMTGGELFDGYRRDKINRLFKEYLLSAVVITNAMANSRLLTTSGDKIIINDTPKVIKEFIYELEEVDRLFHKDDPNIKSKIRLAILSPAAKRLVDLLRKK